MNAIRMTILLLFKKNHDDAVIFWNLYLKYPHYFPSSDFNTAIKNHHDIIGRFYLISNENKYKIMYIATTYDHLNVLDYVLHNSTLTFDFSVMNTAIYNNSKRIVKYLGNNRTEGYSLSALIYAEFHNFTEIMEFLNSKPELMRDETIESSIESSENNIIST